MIKVPATGLMYEKWLAEETPPKAVMLLVHGLGGHCGRWEFLAGQLSKFGIAGYAVELRGFGLNERSAAGHIDSFNEYFADIAELCAIIRKEHPQKKIFLLGESMGGLLAYLAAIRELKCFGGLICISPAFKNKLKLSFAAYLKIIAALFYNPRKRFPLPFDSQMCTRDIGYQKKMESDKREHRQASARLLFNLLLAQQRAAIFKNKLKTPLLFLVAGDDQLVYSRATVDFFDKLKIKDKKLIQYPQMCHALSIDKDRGRVFKDMQEWMKARILKDRGPMEDGRGTMSS